MIVLTLVAQVLDAAKLEREVQDKTFASELGFDLQSEFSKAKHGVRPFDLERVMAAPEETFWSIHRAMAIVRLLRAEGRWRPDMLKAELSAPVQMKESA